MLGLTQEPECGVGRLARRHAAREVWDGNATACSTLPALSVFER